MSLQPVNTHHQMADLIGPPIDIVILYCSNQCFARERLSLQYSISPTAFMTFEDEHSRRRIRSSIKCPSSSLFYLTPDSSGSQSSSLFCSPLPVFCVNRHVQALPNSTADVHSNSCFNRVVCVIWFLEQLLNVAELTPISNRVFVHCSLTKNFYSLCFNDFWSVFSGFVSTTSTEFDRVISSSLEQIDYTANVLARSPYFCTVFGG
ncbi:uncharacterized protein [Physcomitrium patens]|uniref:uncharacterized protein n=1 Tax=Physcomitrium patens TaxID=3218 RepID=UPI003CCDAA51